jgi:sulfur-oxidizing protein SoxX
MEMMMRQARVWLLMIPALLYVVATVHAAPTDGMPPPEPYCQWEISNFAINESLCGLTGDAERGRAIAIDGYQGNCVACHVLPEKGIEAFGNIGPPLNGVGGRYPVGFLRLRVVDSKQLNPATIMPGYYRDPALIHRPAKMLKGRTFLTAQQVEDVIAYLVTLK